MKLIALLFSLCTVAIGQALSAGPATTKGACSPANTGNQNTFNIQCGIGKEQGQKMLGILNKILAGQLDPEAVMAKLEELRKGIEGVGTASQNRLNGLLKPASDPNPADPPNLRIPIPPTAIRIYLGSSLGWTDKDLVRVIRIAGDDVLWLKRSESGVTVSAKIFSSDGHIVVSIEDNEFNVNPNNYFRIKRPDESTLTVFDQNDAEALTVRYMNPYSVRLTGRLHSIRGLISITQSEVLAGRLHIRDAIFGNPGGGMIVLP